MTNRFYSGNIIFIGEPGVGKTSLMVRLLNRNYMPKESESTRGIDLNQWTVVDENNNEIRITLTDFVGQEIFYSLYPLFFRNYSVYVYVHDSRKETDIEFWLSQINQNSKDSQIIIVQSKVDIYSTNYLNQTYLKSKYPNIVSFINTSAATNTGIDELHKVLVESVKKSPNYDKELPRSWTKIMDSIFELSTSRPYITFENFQELCRTQQINDINSIRLLSSYLHDTGVVLHFQKDLVLDSVIILNIDWLLNGIYLVLSSYILKEGKGKLSIGQLNQILNEYSNHEQSIFFQILLLFQLGYRLERGSFIIPIGLPNQQPVKDWDIENSFKFEYHFQTIPLSLIERFIVRNYEIIDLDKTWRSGTVIKINDSKALLISDKIERKIKVWILSANPNEIQFFISSEIEKLLNSYIQVDFKKLIPCICETCINSNEPHLYDFEILKKALSKGRNFVECHVSFSEVEIDRLLFTPSSSNEKLEELKSTKSHDVKFEWNTLNNLFFEFHYLAKKNDIFELFYDHFKHLNSKTINPNLHIVEFENSRAKIENELVNQKVKITIEGDFKEELLAILRHKVQLISKNKNIEFQKFVKCNCEECLYESHYFDFDFLRKRELKGKDIVICEKSANDVNILGLLGRHKSEKDNSGIYIYQNQNNSNDMKIENININDGGVGNFADNITNIAYQENLNISKEDFQSLKDELKNLKEKEVQLIKSKIEVIGNSPDDNKIGLKEDLKNFILECGIAINQNIAASLIFEVLKNAI